MQSMYEQSVYRKPFRGELNPKDAALLLEHASAAPVDKVISVILDFDDTITIENEFASPVINGYLANYIALLIIRTEGISHINFSILSNRSPDADILRVAGHANTIANWLPAFFNKVIERLIHYREDALAKEIQDIQVTNPCVIPSSLWYCLRGSQFATKADKVRELLTQPHRYSTYVYIDDSLAERQQVRAVFEELLNSSEFFVMQVYRFLFELDELVSFPIELNDDGHTSVVNPSSVVSRHPNALFNRPTTSEHDHKPWTNPYNYDDQDLSELR